MKKIIGLLVLVLFFFLFFAVQNKDQQNTHEDQLKIAVLGGHDRSEDEWFIYEPTTLEDLKAEEFMNSSYLNASVLFVYADTFSEVTDNAEYRDALKTVASDIPVVFMDASEFKSLMVFESDLTYEQIVRDSGDDAFLQSYYALPNGDTLIHRADSFDDQNKEALQQAVQQMLLSKSYEEWQEKWQK